MPLRKAYRLRWEPKGLSDAVDGNNTFPGAMAILQNLIPDPSTENAWICRAAAVSLTTFGGVTTPGFVSGRVIVGDIEYGMIASALNSGKDQPYAYNIASNTFLTVTGITSTNVPTSPASSGDWTPPILAQVGNRIIVTHPGFPGGATKFGWFDISALNSTGITGNTHSNTTIDGLNSNVLQAGWQPGHAITGTGIPANTTIVSIAANGLSIVISQNASATATGVAFTVTGGTATSPQWAAGDLNINNLPSVPVSVAQFNGRAYYACGVNGLVFSDSGFACNRTFANQALTASNGLPMTALGPQLLSAPLTGGIVQALIAFQSNVAMQQISGDPATSNLSMNLLPVATGTLAPLSITPTNFGTAFISPDGMRIVKFDGTVTDPIGDHGQGVTVPFINALHPSRICGAANADTIRFTVQRGDVANNPTQEFWFDITRKIWSGPHTFPASLIEPWRNTFVMSAVGINAQLWQSDAVVSTTSTFTENGAVLTWTYQPVLLPDDQDMMMTCIIESSIAIGVGSATVNVGAFDDLGINLGTAQLAAGIGGTLWDSFSWDTAVWDGSPTIYRQHPINWNAPLVAKQFAINVAGNSNASVRVGNLSLRYQRLGYQAAAA